MSGTEPGLFDFGRFRLDTRRRILLQDGLPVALTPKAFDILSLLVALHGRIVEKSEIFDAVWPHTSVEEGNLTVNVSLIRRALGESRTEHRFIVTIPGRGYQFVGDVRRVDDREITTIEQRPQTDTAPVEAIVERVPLAPAIASSWPHANVPAGRLLIASSLLLGVVLAVGAFDSRRNDHATGVENPEARALYLRGRFLLDRRTEEGLTKGRHYFERALERAPGYASAYAGLADAHSMQSYFGIVPPAEAHARAKAAALTALELDPDSAEAHTSMAYILHRFEWNWQAAERSFRRALSLDPEYALAHHWYAAFLGSMGRRDEAIAEARRAELLDPVQPVISVNLNELLTPDSSGDFFERGHRLVEMDPGFWLSHWSIGSVYQSRDQQTLALEEYERAADLAGRGTYVLTRLGVAYAEAGRTSNAYAILRELDALSSRRYVSPYARAPVLAALGEPDQAFQWLSRALEERSTQMAFISVSLSPLRSDPRFEGFLARVGLR